MINETKAQGALEYLLLLVAAMFVVAIVFVFINQTIGPTQTVGSEKNYSFLCGTFPAGLDSNTADCACYTNNRNNFFPTEQGVTHKEYCCTLVTDTFLKAKYNELNPSNQCSN